MLVTPFPFAVSRGRGGGCPLGRGLKKPQNPTLTLPLNGKGRGLFRLPLRNPANLRDWPGFFHAARGFSSLKNWSSHSNSWRLNCCHSASSSSNICASSGVKRGCSARHRLNRASKLRYERKSSVMVKFAFQKAVIQRSELSLNVFENKASVKLLIAFLRKDAPLRSES